MVIINEIYFFICPKKWDRKGTVTYQNNSFEQRKTAYLLGFQGVLKGTSNRLIPTTG